MIQIDRPDLPRQATDRSPRDDPLAHLTLGSQGVL